VSRFSGEALNIDLNDFFVQLYGLLLPLSLDTAIEQAPTSRADNLNPSRQGNSGEKKPPPKRNVQLASTADLLFRCLNLIFFSRHASTANSPPWRAAAFAKRLLECSLHFPSATAIKSIDFAKKLVVKEPKLEALLSTEDRTVDGVYRPEMNDPQLCNPFGASFWELPMLTREHWDENVRAEAEKLARGKLV
jgi:nucleolar complex protein 3